MHVATVNFLRLIVISHLIIGHITSCLSTILIRVAFCYYSKVCFKFQKQICGTFHSEILYKS